MSTSTTSKSLRSRRVKALLATGLVLGVSATVTLASWNATQQAGVTITAGQFGIEGSLGSSGTWNAPTGDPAELEFSAPVDNMTPNDVTYAGFGLRLNKQTTSDATFTLGDATTGGEKNYDYAVYTTADSTCSEQAVQSGTLVRSGVVGADVTGLSDPLDLSKTTDAQHLTAGDPVYLCFKVTAQADLVQGSVTNALWKMQATSK